MSAPRAAAQLFRIAGATRSFVPPATTRAGTAQRAVPTIALNTFFPSGGEGWGEGVPRFMESPHGFFSECIGTLNLRIARQRLGLRQSSGAFGWLASIAKAPAAVAPKRRYGAPRRREDWRTPKPGGSSHGLWKVPVPHNLD